ncbi:hypothetical protein FPOAC1_003624 [Fusarium poae]|uniref:hypothetical protein n=1 Tax=Fusarium poae TaxID=36050 RepID=UPI001CE79E3C|nr:hypothetical protein FPOAC1_003624 [Fusarium poae]KAG8677600.1 hypothetical protein FPOAC1_003624 [Fusarium poae]
MAQGDSRVPHAPTRCPFRSGGRARDGEDEESPEAAVFQLPVAEVVVGNPNAIVGKFTPAVAADNDVKFLPNPSNWVSPMKWFRKTEPWNLSKNQLSDPTIPSF